MHQIKNWKYDLSTILWAKAHDQVIHYFGKDISLETSSLSDSKAQLHREVRQLLHSKVMKTKQEQNYYCHHQHRSWKLVSMEQVMVHLFWLIAIILQQPIIYICFLKPIPENLTSMRFRSLGLNREIKDASYNTVARTFYPNSRFRPESGRLNITNKWIGYTIYNIRAIHCYTSFRVSEWIISRATKWFRNYNQFINTIYYRHDAADGRQTGCYLQPTH